MSNLLNVLVLTAAANGWPLTAIPIDPCVDSLVSDGYARSVARHCLKLFFEPNSAEPGGVWSVVPRKLCLDKAKGILHSNEETKWKVPEFLEAWKKQCPEGIEPSLEMLR